MSQVSASLPHLALEAQDFSLPNTEDITSQKVEAEVSDSQVSSEPVFFTGVNVPLLKKYYKKLKRNLTISIFASQLVLLFSIYFAFVAVSSTWGWSVVDNITFVKSAFDSVKSASTWAQVPTTVGFAFTLFGLGKNFWRLFRQKRRIDWESDLCQAGRYPTYLTPALNQKAMTLFGWRINSYWTGFTIIGLSIVTALYAYLVKGFRNSSNGWEIKWNELHTNLFKWDQQPEDKIFRVTLATFVFGLLVIGITNPICRGAIKRLLNVFNSDEASMHRDLKEKVFRLNKRDKIISTVILCVLGLAIFIILKRLIIAVFNRSFNVSKW
ncbi:hypothetical protein [Mycoplasma ovis]|uniref:hypothetical protein n=1 Tax=Mycoplasma ovis TaxID=171632 RepID=UPI0003F9CB7F|nr:hypothetical protein [Mycoplasma ovis]